jgi:hypothetical protein
MTASKRITDPSVWIYALALVLLLMVGVSLSTQIDAPQAKPQAGPSDPVRSALIELLQDERVPDKAWLLNARQWPGNGTVTDATSQVMGDLWPLLLKDVELMQTLAPPLMQTARMQKLRDQLKPYLSAEHPPSRASINQFDRQIQQQLRDMPSEGVADGQPLSWTTLERVAWDMGDIQDTLRNLRRLALDSAGPNASKLSQRVFIDLSWVFPTAEVREFQNTANRAVQRRWALLYQLEKNRPQTASTPSVDAPQPPSGFNHQITLLLLGALGLLLLLRAQRKQSQTNQALDQSSQYAQTLQDQCTRLSRAIEQLESAQPAQQVPRPGASDIPFANALPDLRGRIKRVQWRFDSGQSLELAQQDLAIVEDKLRQWEEHLKWLAVKGPEDHHA